MKQMLLLPFILFTLTHCFANPVGGDPPVAGYSYYIEYIGYGSEVSFLNESIDGLTYLWDFGDGGTSTDVSPVHAYPEPGIFIVCLTATNDFGTDTFCDTINTYYPPSADFSFAGDPLVLFTDLSTNYPESWDWFFGDGDTSTLQNPEHTYLMNGDYNVCLSVNNPGGTSYTCKTVTISSYPVTVAAFIYSGDPFVSFTDLSTESPFAWFWDFDDGDTSVEQNPEHTYLDNGTFHVCLTATNAGGSNTACEDVVIAAAIAPPATDFTYLINGLECAFVDISTNDPFAWLWDFGDEQTSVEQNPIHVYADAGNYSVCLTATNAGGDDTECKELLIETGIENNNADSFTVTPNPADDELVIELNQALPEGQLAVFDMAGKQIDIDAAEWISGNKIRLNIKNLSAGNYLFRIYNDTIPFATGKFTVK